MRSPVARRVSFAFLSLVLAIPSLRAQTFRGGINGTVVDPSGAAVPAAKITATDEATQVEHNTVSSSAGEYSFQEMPLGTYTVSVGMPGFETMKVSGVRVTAGTVYTLPITLSVAKQATTVQVSASALSLDTTTTTQTTDIPEVTVQNIPLNGRDFTQMIGLAPGFAGYSLGGYGSVNGTRANQVNWQIDGSDNNDWWHNIPAVNQGGVENIAGVTLPIDSIAEFSLQTQSSSEVGRNPGGTVNLVTKSGTNVIHGSAYYYERNQALAATNPFDTLGDLPLSNIQWGASLGGPFWKDHTFWFANYERQKFNIATGNTGVEPNAGYQAQAVAVLNRYEVPINPSMQNLISILWPSILISGTAPSVQSSAPEFGYSNNGVIKIDHNFSPKQSVSARAFLGQGNQTAPVGTTDVNPWFFEIGPIHVYNYSVADNWVVTPAISNQLTVGVNYFNQTFSDAKTDFGAVASAGFIDGSSLPNAPNIEISGFEPTGNTPPEGRNDITGILDDTLNWVKGKHQFRIGGGYRQAQVNEFYHRHATGNFKFNNNYPSPWQNDDTIDSKVASLADFLAGYLYTGSIAFGDPERTVYSRGFNLFFQDNYQLTPTLNINYGARYDVMQPMHDSKKDLSIFRPGLTPTGIAFQGDQIGQIYATEFNSISPRVGFAWNLKKGTVVRGGGGMFFDTPNANPFLDNRPGNNAPNGLEGNPGGSNPVVNASTTDYTITSGQQIIPTPNASNPCPSSNPCGVFSVDKGFRSPYNLNYSLQIEQSLGKAFFQIGYVGSEGRKLLSLLNINQVQDNGEPGLYGGPYSGNFYGDINQIESIGTSNYNSLQAIFRTNSWHGVTTQASYTWGHNLDEVTQYRGALPQDSYNFKGDYGDSDFDTHNSFVGYIDYDVPKFWGPKLLTDGWELNSAFAFKGGQPITVYTATDTSVVGEGFQRANIVENTPQLASHRSIQHDSSGLPFVQWLNPNAYSQPAQNTFGDAQRNGVFGPGFGDFDLSVFKNTKFDIHDYPITAQFRAEMYNLFNRVNLSSPACTQLCTDYWDGPSGVGSAYSSGGFGTTSSTIGSGNFSPGIGPGEPFNIQLALKLLF